MLSSSRTIAKAPIVDPHRSTLGARVVRPRVVSARFGSGMPTTLAMLTLIAGSIGCGRTMTQADCEKVGNHMREVWDSDVKANAPSVPEGAAQDLAQLVIKNHRERIGSEWMNQCRRELEGRHVDEKELDCIMRSKAIADVQSCATRSGE